MDKKIFVVGGSEYYTRFLHFDYQLCNNMKNADIVMFTGGEDVHPAIYNCKEIARCSSYLPRDLQEKAIFNEISDKQLVIGICRGSQFCCAMNGGILVQDCDNHAIRDTHLIHTMDNEEYMITSTHHQMQCPYVLDPKEYTIYAWATRSTYYHGDQLSPEILKKLREREPEIVIYHKENKPKCIAIQGHPEMMSKDTDTVAMLNKLILKYL